MFRKSKCPTCGRNSPKRRIKSPFKGKRSPSGKKTQELKKYKDVTLVSSIESGYTFYRMIRYYGEDLTKTMFDDSYNGGILGSGLAYGNNNFRVYQSDINSDRRKFSLYIMNSRPYIFASKSSEIKIEGDMKQFFIDVKDTHKHMNNDDSPIDIFIFQPSWQEYSKISPSSLVVFQREGLIGEIMFIDETFESYKRMLEKITRDME